MMMMMMTKRRSRLVIFYKKYQQEETTWRCSYVSLCVRKREKQAHTHTRDLLIEFNVDKKKYFFSLTRARASSKWHNQRLKVIDLFLCYEKSTILIARISMKIIRIVYRRIFRFQSRCISFNNLLIPILTLNS
jgi:hypothetical protein